jgi:hypothetical protein
LAGVEGEEEVEGAFEDVLWEDGALVLVVEGL